MRKGRAVRRRGRGALQAQRAGQRPLPLPILCPADGVARDGVLPHLGFVEGCCNARQSCLNLLPYVGPGWYPKVSLAAMLELGVCRWDHIVLGISARSHVDAATLRRTLERMDAAWPEGEEHMAKLSVNAIIGSTACAAAAASWTARTRTSPRPSPARGAWPYKPLLAGNSLLLTGLPGTGKTHLARTIVARLREQGEAVHLLRAEPGPGGANGRPLGAQERARGQRAKAGLAGGGSRSWTWRSGRTWPAWD